MFEQATAGIAKEVFQGWITLRHHFDPLRHGRHMRRSIGISETSLYGYPLGADAFWRGAELLRAELSRRSWVNYAGLVQLILG